MAILAGLNPAAPPTPIGSNTQTPARSPFSPAELDYYRQMLKVASPSVRTYLLTNIAGLDESSPSGPPGPPDQEDLIRRRKQRQTQPTII